MGRRIMLVALCVSAAGLLGGCGPQTPQMPITKADYEKLQKSDASAFTKQTIVLHNMQRVLDGDLPAAQRVASLELLTILDENDPDMQRRLAGVLADAANPPELHQAVLAYLLKKNYPDLALYVAKALPNIAHYQSMQESVLDWISKHPAPEALGEIVRLWAAQQSITGPLEPRFRETVENITSKAWDEALLDALNTRGFSAPAAALDVLSRRVSEKTLHQRLSAPQAVTDELGAIQLFMNRLDYLPATDSEFSGVVAAYRVGRDGIEDAARLAAQWREETGYKFNIRDFHLLSGLARDPLRKALHRTELVAEITRSLSARTHEAYAGPDGKSSDNFVQRLESLNQSDLWTIYLLDELLTRPRIQMAMRALSLEDRGDATGAFGGAIFYETGQAVAKKYEGLKGANDLVYIPTPRLLNDSLLCMCRFICHFERANNAARVGPTAAELQDARESNYCGVILTSTSEDTFAVHYYNPQGVVISLGVMPLKKQQ